MTKTKIRLKRKIFLGLLLMLTAAISAYAEAPLPKASPTEDPIDLQLAAKIHEIIKDAPYNSDYHITPEDLYRWIKLQKTNFQVVDVRTDKKFFENGHIPNSIFIDYGELFKPENLKKLPKNKKIIVVCEMGASAAMTVVPLRMLGYEAYNLLMGLASWDKNQPVIKEIQDIINAPKNREEPFPLEKGE